MGIKIIAALHFKTCDRSSDAAGNGPSNALSCPSSRTMLRLMPCQAFVGTLISAHDRMICIFYLIFNFLELIEQCPSLILNLGQTLFETLSFFEQIGKGW